MNNRSKHGLFHRFNLRVHTAIANAFHSRADSVAWRRQNIGHQTNPMYNHVYLGGIGTLIDHYEQRKSDEEFRKLLVRKFERCLCNRGAGKMLTKLEYARFWKTLRNVDTIDSYRTTSKDLLRELDRWFLAEFDFPFEEHETCWDIRQRGEVGETILHLCYLNNTEVHIAIAEHLLHLYPKLCLDVYEGFEYYGESSLHLAIVNGDLNSVKLLCRCGANLQQRATGRFFRPTKILIEGESGKDKEVGDDDGRGQAYYGEFPLAFAASLGNKVIYDFLIEESVRVERRGEVASRGYVNPNDQDSYGNTVLHMVVINNQLDMLSHVVRHSIMPASIEMRNEAGLTPLELSFRLGRCGLFDRLLDLGSQTQWSYGPLSYVAYPLPGLDSIRPNGQLDESSALMTIVRCGQAQHLKMLEVPVVDYLLQEKWKRYGKQRLLLKFIVTVMQLLALSTVAIVRRPNLTGAQIHVERRPFHSRNCQDSRSGVFTKLLVTRYVAECVVILICVWRTVEFGVEIHSRRSLRSYAKTLIELPEKGFMFIATILFLLCVPLRILCYQLEEDALIVMASPLSWMYLLYFCRANRNLGPLVVMFGRMCIGDIAKFSILYVTFVSMFSAVFHIASNTEEFNNWFDSMATTFCMTFGRYGVVNTISVAKQPVVAGILMVLFAILVPILLLNMLIAMMAKTYSEIMARALMEWKRQWAMIIVQVERSLGPKQLACYQKEYSASITFDQPQATNLDTATKTNFSRSLSPPTLLSVSKEPPGTPTVNMRRRSWASYSKDQQQLSVIEEDVSLLRRGKDVLSLSIHGPKTGKGVSCRAILTKKLIDLQQKGT
ncbi:transient receptor potential cation channel subfamily V member 5-like [Diadema setosum]|uniref:transient receptor potential cation channel subfamily V member 5-like n=1 Tax=Diadema setosum TaxID=31175 RepID=UPI003B3B0D9B